MYALIIAGGEGERLRPLTNDRPKAMVAVRGRPLVEHQLEWLRQGGVTHAILLARYKAEVLQAHLRDGACCGVKVLFSLEDEPLGRGGALRKGFGLVPPGEEFVFAVNGDILTEQPIADILRAHRRKRSTATVMLTRLRSPYGIASLDRTGRITNFTEKPLLPYWINAGVYVFSREFFALLPEKGDHEDTTFPLLSAQGRLLGLKSIASWRSIDTFKDLREAERELAIPARP